MKSRVQSRKPMLATRVTTEAPPSILAIALGLMAVLLVMVILRLQPPQPKGADAAPDQFSAGRAMRLLQDLLIEGVPHPMGSEANARMRDRLVAKLEALGYAVELQEAFACGAFQSCAPVENILARLPGREAGPAVMLMAHYDSRPVATGAADDGAALATMLEIARLLKREGPYRNPVFLLFTDGEEAGLFGAEAFAAEHPRASQVGVAVNLEARGTGGLSLLFETSENNAWLISDYAVSVPRPIASSLFYQIYRNMPNTTDLAVFKRKGVAGLNLAFVDQAVYYHTPFDNLDHIELGSLQHQGDTALALVRRLAEADQSHPPQGNAVYSDILGLAILWWPEPWTPLLALLIDAVLLAVAVRLVLTGPMSVRSMGWGLLAWIASILISILLGAALLWVISKLAGTASPWFAYPLPMRLVLWSGALLVGVGIANLFSRRAGFWGLGLGTWIGWAILSSLSALMLPALSEVFLVPAGVAAFALAIVCFTSLRSSPFASRAGFIVAALAAGVFWMQLALLLEMVLGLGASPVIMLSLALTVSTLSPLFAYSGQSERWPRRLMPASATVLLVSAVAAIFVPNYSETRPRPVNLIHFEDRDTGVAQWIAMSSTGDLPASLRQAGHFVDKPGCVLPWSVGPCFAATAESLAEPAPELVLVSDESVQGERIIQARLRSSRGGNRVSLIAPRQVPLKAIYMEGKPVPFGSDKEEFRFFECVNCPRDGLNVEIHLEGNDPAEVMIADFSSGLPAAGDSLIHARAPVAVPFADGDVTMILRRVNLVRAQH